ncbi:hypothetical protein MTR_8g022600 [Medicago truncatula]|uniref:Uncharacterized protein n=1 Tax=Medicago truncatula TaxID=3880 RepID=G7L922_MEDTR|nr:hypothetical protein MTR_8g022600 [Medicago truncatula]
MPHKGGRGVKGQSHKTCGGGGHVFGQNTKQQSRGTETATAITIKAMKLEPRRREGSRRRHRKRCGGGKGSSKNTTFLY